MKKGINQIHLYMTSILKNIHESALKTLSMLVWGFLLAKKPIIADIARKLNYKSDFEIFYQRIWRFLSQSKFKVEDVCSDIAEHLLSRMSDAKVKRMVITLDWTDIGVFKVLFASIPVKGRTKPIFFKLWEIWDIQDRMTMLEMQLVEELLAVVPKYLRHKVVFVADRGFAKTQLMKHIQDLGARFVIRLPRGCYVQIHSAQWVLVESVDIKESEVKYYPDVLFTKDSQFKINFTITQSHEWELKHKEDVLFLIASNLDDPKEILRDYIKRPKIEQMFKDFKKRGLKIEQMLIETSSTARKMILIVMLYYIICILTAIEFVTQSYLSRIQRNTKRGKLSLFAQGDYFVQDLLLEPLSRDLINFVNSWFIAPKKAAA